MVIFLPVRPDRHGRFLSPIVGGEAVQPPRAMLTAMHGGTEYHFFVL